jgi:predicted neutral ceramidase superfamily lipid hydrolase
MNAEDIARKYYTRLFILPRGERLLIIYVGIFAVVGLINSIPPFSLSNTLRTVIQYLILGSVLPIIYSPLLATKIFNPKRIVGLSGVMFLVSLPAELVFPRLLGFRGIGLLASSGLAFTILSAFYGTAFSVLVSTLPPLLAFKFVNDYLGTYVNNLALMAAIATEALSLILGSAYLIIVEAKGRKFGFSPIAMTRAFLKTWFTGDPVKIENELTRYSETGTLKVKTILIERKGDDPLALIFPTLHYGPFRNIGSARFIYHLESYLEPKFKPFIFHTPGSHEHNLVSSEESEEVAKIIHTTISKYASILAPQNLCEPYRVRNDGWEAFVLPLSYSFAAFIENTREGGDDLPHDLWEIIEKDSRAPLMVALADSHAFKGERILNVDIFKPLINKILMNNQCSESHNVLIGYGEAFSTSILRGICNPKVKSMTININGRRYAIIYIYGNNMDGKYRNKLIKLVKSYGIIDAEIVTPDDHSCAASFKETPYDIVSESESLTKAVEESLRNAINSEAEANFSTLEVIIEGVKFMGEKIWDMMRGLDTLGKLSEKLLVITAVLVNIAPVPMLLIY